MKIRKNEILNILLILASFLIGFYYYNDMPSQVASHWNAAGQVDGYMSKFWGLFLMPIISVVMLVMFYVIPVIDPHRNNIKKFRQYFDNFISILFAFLLYIYILTLYWNLGHTFNMVVFLLPAFSILFYYAGILVSVAEPNWFIGIRTPWTLSSETVWKKTHDLGGKIFKYTAFLGLLGLIFQKWAIWFVMVPVLLGSFYTIFYSYLVYRKENKDETKK